MKKLLFLGLCLLLSACSSQRIPDFYRIDSNASDARVRILDGDAEVLNMSLPVDLDEDDFSSGTVFVIEKPGYVTFEGTIGDMRKVAKKSYYVELQPLR